MDDLSISLPCGFSAKYKDIFYSNGKFPCPICKTHELTSQDCFSMTRNRLLLNEFNIDQKKSSFTQCLKNLEICKNDPKSIIDQSYEFLKNQLDIRREEIKLMVNRKIDGYYENLLRIIDDEKHTKLKKFEEDIQKIPSLEQEIILDIFNIQTVNKAKRLENIENYCAKIDDGIKFLNKAKDDLMSNNWIFSKGNGIFDITALFGELIWKEECKNFKKNYHINKINKQNSNIVSIILPCGFSMNYQEIFSSKDKFQCPVCKTHDIIRYECLNMTRNKMLINEINFDLKKNKYEELMKELEKYKNDPKYYNGESFNSLKREVDCRREEVKDMINKRVDDYYDGLLEKIDMERDLKLKDIEERIQNIDPFDLARFKIDENLNIHSKLEFYRKSKIEIDNGISLVQNIIDDLNESKFKLTDSCDEIDIKKLFGEFYLREKTKIILNNQEIDDDSRTKATIQLTINNFSLLKNKKNYDLYSEDCIVQNFEWYIAIRLNGIDGWMEFYLHCNSKAESNKFPVNANVVLSLLNKSDSRTDLTRNFEYLFGENECGRGFYDFVSMNEIMDPINGYYCFNDDSISLKAVVKA
ncbi:ubiquitin carboxyl-terminal hydrolase 7 isoform X2 [Brachionus plicatilis]|uniref:Ubiquitin carboxyl-terminal hydrolase 7 isoform X2 n=1 Tax=Brachionus plicatilis TaxID=10195 RepID=A0A3M7T7B6_BRAPC|nr:ubiquitin carboxyl-terminal hydrolase 7 isoform X2 [Brachionus plicatilis]